MGGKKILVVDDDPDHRALADAYLKAAGYQVIFAQDGLSGVSAAQRHRPDLIVLDLGLPAGDGITVLGRLKKLSPVAEIPVLVASARDPEHWRDVALGSAAVAYLQKPIEKDSFLEAVRSSLGQDELPQSGVMICCPSCGHNFTPDDAHLDPGVVERIAAKVTRAILRENPGG